MKQIIRLTESDLHRLVKESVYRILEGTDASASGDVNRSVFPMMRRPSPVGEATDEEIKPVDASDAVDRKGGKNHSISVNGVNENINEFNWKAAALGGMLALSSPMQGNAQTQNYQPQQNDTVQVGNSRLSSAQKKDFSDRARNARRAAGDSEETINAESNIMTNFNTAYRNSSRGESNSQIEKYLYSMSPSESTKNIFVSKGSGNKELRDFFGNMNVNTAMKYKVFELPDEVYVVMPVSYTLQDVQNELGTLQLGDFDI